MKKQMDGSALSPGFYDLNEDGVIDTLAFLYLGHAAMFISDNGVLPWDEEPPQGWEAYFKQAFCAGEGKNPWNPERADWGSYTLLIDKDDCGRFDSLGDFCYRAFDLNGDGAPEAEYYHLFPGEEWCPYSNKFVVNVNGERDLSYLDFLSLTYPDEQIYDAGGKYRMNVHGSGFFLNSYSLYPKTSWETPIAWYDFDFDGKTDMVMRVGDTANNEIAASGGLRSGEMRYSGKASEFELAFELNGNTSEERYHSLDLALSFYNYHAPDLDYTQYTDTAACFLPLKGSEPFYGALLETRCQVKRQYLPYLDGAKIGLSHPGWEACFLLFDEDDDDCRWEEMFSNHEGHGEKADFLWTNFSDHLGDRTEKDPDCAGKGKLYISPMDGKIHLFRAKYAWWEIDYLGLFKGSKDHPFETEGPMPPKGLLYHRVRYFDTDQNGFIDTIRYERVAFGQEEETAELIKEICLLDYADEENPHPDKAALFDPRPDVDKTGFCLAGWNGEPFGEADFKGSPAKVCYDGVKALYEQVCARMWQSAKLLYDCAVRHKLNFSEMLDRDMPAAYDKTALLSLREYPVPPGYSRHLAGQTLREQYHNGFWLREKVFADLCSCPALDRFTLEKYYYTARYEALCAYVDQTLAL